LSTDLANASEIALDISNEYRDPDRTDVFCDDLKGHGLPRASRTCNQAVPIGHLGQKKYFALPFRDEYWVHCYGHTVAGIEKNRKRTGSGRTFQRGSRRTASAYVRFLRYRPSLAGPEDDKLVVVMPKGPIVTWATPKTVVMVVPILFMPIMVSTIFIVIPIMMFVIVMIVVRTSHERGSDDRCNNAET
jgi:hypothetical protein